MTLEQCWHDVPGGTAVAAIESARALARRDDVSLVGVAAAHRRPAPPAWAPPVDVAHLRLPRLALYESWHRLRRPPVEAATGPVDVVHATTMAIPPRSAPLVLTVHDLAFLHHPAHFTRRGLSFFRRGLELARSDADLVLCPSSATLQDCAAHGFESGRLRLVPLGVDAAAVAASDVDRIRRLYDLPRPYVLWTGTIEPRKNLTTVLAAWRKAGTGCDLVLVGPGGWNYKLTAVGPEERERVRVLGFVPHADIAPIYAGARVLCWPSLLEGFGFPVLEAMAQGTPVVTSRGSSTEEIAGGAALLVDPTDAEDVAGALERVLGDEALASELSAAGRKRAASYTWERTAELTLQAYREVA